jgi:hypothetical protein
LGKTGKDWKLSRGYGPKNVYLLFPHGFQSGLLRKIGGIIACK